MRNALRVKILTTISSEYEIKKLLSQLMKTGKSPPGVKGDV